MSKSSFETRYPQLTFLLSHEKSKKKSSLLGVSEEEIEEMLAHNEPLQMMMVIGLDDGKIVQALIPWLEQSPKRDLFLFEPDLKKIKEAIKGSDYTALFMHPQIHLRYVMRAEEMKQALIEALQEYPSEHFDLYIHPSYRDKWNKEVLFEEISRKGTLTSSMFIEQAYYHVLFENLIQNMNSFSQAFYADALKGAFQGIPAIVCGAGPSLSEEIQNIKNTENRALVFAGGSTIAALTTQGVSVHLGFALDPNPDELQRLLANVDPEVPMLYSHRVHSGIFSTLSGFKGYMRTHSGGFVEQALEQELKMELPPLQEGLSEEGLSVTVMCLAAAIHCGCSPIFLCGIDLAYLDGKRYAEGVVTNPSICLEKLKQESKAPERLVLKTNCFGKEVYTTIKWIMEAATIEEFVKKYPEQKVYATSKQGLGFESLEFMSLSDGVQNLLKKQWDLRAYVHQAIQNAPQLSDKKEDIEAFLQKLHQSVQRSLDLTRSMQQHLKKKIEKEDFREDAFMTLCELDLLEEEAYQWFLSPLEPHIPFLFLNDIRLKPFYEDELEHQKDQLLFSYKKWSHFYDLLVVYFEKFQKR